MGLVSEICLYKSTGKNFEKQHFLGGISIFFVVFRNNLL